LTANAGRPYAFRVQFLSDNAAAVHPAVWAAMQAADAPQPPYDNDDLSRALDDRFSDLFGRPAWGLWVASGTAANCLALATMVPPHGGVVCHREAHIEMDEGGAPGFYLHGAKLMLADGEGAKLTPAAIAAVIDPVRDDVHQVQPHAVSITQATEYGRTYHLAEIAAVAEFAAARGLPLHMDGARFANAVAFHGAPARDMVQGVAALSFGFIKNGGLGAEAIVFFDEAAARLARYRRKRAGHLQSKGRFMAAQIHAMLDGDVWLVNARHANAAAAELASGVTQRLLHPVEANEVFVRLSAAEREVLRGHGFGFYDWGHDAARFVTAWNSRDADVAALARALAGL
jgi:threonine aldolase